MNKGMTYAASGVDYDPLDAFKRKAQSAARRTGGNISVREGLHEISSSRGESAYLVDTPEMILAHVEEGLGTKNLVADAMYTLTGKSYYDHVAQCTVAMIVNDMVTLGALPISVAMHVAAGDSKWFSDQARTEDLISGWKAACDLARCSWGAGETPTLKGVVNPETVVLSGSSVGQIRPKSRMLRADDIQDSDVILMLESSGIHANGLTLARKISEGLPDGYLTKLPDGRTYGETLLDPTHIYVDFLDECFAAGIDIHYAVNITGHGWRKLMRADRDLTYVIDTLPTERPIFPFLQERGPIDDLEAYGNLNMGAGFAIYVPESSVEKILKLVSLWLFTYRVFAAGHIESGEKRVVIRPKGLEFKADTLQVR